MAVAATASRVDLQEPLHQPDRHGKAARLQYPAHRFRIMVPQPDPDSAAQQAIRFLRDPLAARPAVPA